MSTGSEFQTEGTATLLSVAGVLETIFTDQFCQ